MRRGFDSTDAHQLIVRNLPAYIGWQEVKDVFKEFGASGMAVGATSVSRLIQGLCAVVLRESGSCLHVRMGKDRTAMVHMAEDDVAKDALGMSLACVQGLVGGASCALTRVCLLHLTQRLFMKACCLATHSTCSGG